MEDQFRQSLLLLSQLLHDYDVRHLIIGGAAVALHGHYRHSMGPKGEPTLKPDIDIWYEPSYENYFKVIQLIEALGSDATRFKEEVSPDPKKSIFKLDAGTHTLDLLPGIKANIPFSEAYSRKETAEENGISIHYIGYLDLIEDKKALAREKDQEDIIHLRKAKGGS